MIIKMQADKEWGNRFAKDKVFSKALSKKQKNLMSLRNEEAGPFWLQYQLIIQMRNLRLRGSVNIDRIYEGHQCSKWVING